MKITGKITKKFIDIWKIVERKRFEEKASPEDIMKAVTKIFGVEEKDMKSRGKRENTAR